MRRALVAAASPPQVVFSGVLAAGTRGGGDAAWNNLRGGRRSYDGAALNFQLSTPNSP